MSANCKKILIIDDSALMRRVLSDIINSDERFTVSDSAVNGLEGLELIKKNYSSYGAVILDINMPKMNGIQMLEELEKSGIKIPVIIVSTIAREGAAETIRCLELGAFDFVTKPDSFAEAKSDSFKKKIVDMLCSAIKEPIDFSGFSVPKPEPPKPQFVKSERRKVTKGKKLVALACSTGGPKALQQVIPYLPANLDAPVLIVQHMPEGFTLSLANRLGEMGTIAVKEAQDGEIIKKGQVYMAKGGYQMRLEQSAGESYLTLSKDPPRGGLRPCADIMYESLMGTDYDLICCVVLTGMGGDGSQGITQLNDTNNIYVIAQDEETCTVYGMPKMAYETGLVDEVHPLNMIADAITRAVGVQSYGCKPVPRNLC
ncbi:MAG: chemotaxis-specific protein-glutamate methyltransferase CheB [Lachnospiraceae bacterium]|nr:chemotaxis-specific protein-glutamate methyltransferase CheB [Lachnospiraceae bacterium]